MAKYRTEPCKDYVCEGECRQGKKAVFNGLCQRCGSYEPRAVMKRPNRKREKLDKMDKSLVFQQT